MELTVSIEKTKGMAVGNSLTEEDVAPVQEEGGEIEMVEQFSYLGSVISKDGDVMEDVKCRIAKASKAFGCLRGSIFNSPLLSIPTKRAMYRATVLSVLMYGADTWTLKAEHVRRLLLCKDHLRSYKVPAVGAETDITGSCQQVWHGLVHPRHHHGQKIAVVGTFGTYGR